MVVIPQRSYDASSVYPYRYHKPYHHHHNRVIVRY
jgi:hypothetical protein